MTTPEALRAPDATTEIPDNLWHVAATDVESARADKGLPWRTLCGQLRPPMREVGGRDFGTESDDCVVCDALLGGAA